VKSLTQYPGRMLSAHNIPPLLRGEEVLLLRYCQLLGLGFGIFSADALAFVANLCIYLFFWKTWRNIHGRQRQFHTHICKQEGSRKRAMITQPFDDESDTLPLH